MDVLVSINCITYNHENYIGDAIESFLMQKTNFDFEIIIGDDCSTDNTKNIIREYVEKYPGKIILVDSQENVGWMKNSIRIHEKSRGKYVALCEGDDYWIDQYKLQKQIDYMEKNEKCTLCFHNAYKISDDCNSGKKKFFARMNNNEKYDVGKLATLFIPTASRIYRKYTMDNLPVWYESSIVGDLPSQLIQTNYGYAYYMKDIMSVYRVNVETSATKVLFGKKNSKEKKIDNCNRVIELLDNCDKYTNYKYKKFINKRKMRCIIDILLIEKDIKKIKKYSFYKKINIKQRFQINTYIYLPILLLLIKIKAKIKKLGKMELKLRLNYKYKQ